MMKKPKILERTQKEIDLLKRIREFIDRGRLDLAKTVLQTSITGLQVYLADLQREIEEKEHENE